MVVTITPKSRAYPRTERTPDTRIGGRFCGIACPALIFFLTFLIISCIGTASASSDGQIHLTSPTAIISNYATSPTMFMPGDTGTLTITLENTAQSATVKENTGIYSGSFAVTKSTDINVYIENVHLEGHGIIVKSPDFNRLGELGPGQSLPVTFLIQAPDNDGIYFPEVWVDIKGGTSTRYPVPVNVNTHIAVSKKPNLVIIKKLPGSVIPGDDFSGTLVITNDGQSRADDLAITINSSTSSIALKSPANYYADHLDPGSEKQLDLQFSSDKNAPLGLRDVMVTMNWQNPDGIRSHQTEHIGIPVKGKAEIGIASLATDPVRINPGDPFTMTVRIENTGTGDANSVQASVDLPMTGNKEAFVGKIEPKNDAPAVFYLKDKGSGELNYTLRVQYSDDYGTHSVDKKLMLSVAPPNYAGTIVMLVILAILAAGGYWYWRTTRKQ